MLCIYPQNKAKYGLINRDFIKICLYSRENSVYYGLTLDQKFLALQKIYASISKKSWVFYKQCFYKRIRNLVSRNLEELRVV